MSILKPETIEIIVKYQVKSKMANYAENFFIRMNDEKHRRQDEWDTILYRLEKKEMRKMLRVVDPFIQEQNGMYEIIHDVDGEIEVVFSSKSRRKTFKKWKFYGRMKRWQSEPPYDKWDRKLIMVANGKRARVCSWLYSEKDIDDFFGKRSVCFRKRLLKVNKWFYDILQCKRNRSR